MVNCTVRACLKYLIMIVIDKTREFQPCMFFLIFDKENTNNAAYDKSSDLKRKFILIVHLHVCNNKVTAPLKSK